MRYEPDGAPDYAPPNGSWEEHQASEDAQSYLTLYYCEDEISKYPVREVTKVNDNKSDPNLETMSYGLCSTCTRDIRSGLVKNNRPYLFFCTNIKGERHLAGYYHIGWYSLGPPLFTNYRNDSIQDDYRLVADEMKWIYPPVNFETVADETGFDGILTGFRKKLISPKTTDALLGLFEKREDRSQEYLDEIQRLELINKRYHEYRYPTWEREAGFDWESVQNYVGTMQTGEDNETKEILETKMDTMNIDLSLIASESVSDWFCLICDHEFENKAPLKLCPNCDNAGGIIPARAINI